MSSLNHVEHINRSATREKLIGTYLRRIQPKICHQSLRPTHHTKIAMITHEHSETAQKMTTHYARKNKNALQHSTCSIHECYNDDSPGHSFEPPLGSSSPETAARSQFRPANNITSQLLHVSTVIFPCDYLLPTVSNDGLAYRRYSMPGGSWYVHISPTLLAAAAIVAGHSGVSLSQIPVAG